MNRRDFLKAAAMVTISPAVTIPNNIVNSGFHYWQLEYLKYFDLGLARFGILEWHRRARKTTLAVNQLARQACKHAHCKYVYISPTQVQTRALVWDDPNMLANALPDKRQMNYKLNETKMLVTFENGSMIKFGGSDNPDALRGIDAVGVVPDEFALIDPTVWSKIFRPIMSGEVKYKRKKSEGEISPEMRWALFLYTPKGINHAPLMFNIAACVEDEAKLPRRGKAAKCKPGWFASRLIADESGIIPRKELDMMLEEVAQGLMTIEDYDQEMQCRRVTDEERTLITSKMLARLEQIEWEIYRDSAKEIRRIVAIEPAFGGDLCCIKAFENGREITQRGLHLKLTSEVCHVAKVVAEEIDTRNFIVDCIGVGKGVADYLADDVAGYDVQYFDSAAKARVKGVKSDVIADCNLWANKKAEAVAYAASLIRRLKVESIVDAETKRQLVALSKYKVTGSGRTIMILNDDVKKAIGCSPDKGLCWIYGQWGLQYVDPIRNEERVRYDEAMKDHRERKRRTRRGRRPMRMG
ncbi:hypothetical protein LCGC14_0390880 [marine sediment metagenome]|uniref:Terminase large subunit gp17-like C-terminal domain-containing protein n=1 Tax=marine sediment metagenome TaxID=412755 RepID=A0A0F9W8S9_9ZZZZ